MAFLFKSLSSAMTSTGDFTFCPSCGTNFGILGKSKCEACKRTICDHCMKRANNGKAGSLCGGCKRLKENGILNSKNQSSKKTIIEIGQLLKTNQPNDRKYNFKEFIKEYQSKPELYTFEFIAEAGLVPYLQYCFQEEESRLFVSYMMKETIIYNVNLNKTYSMEILHIHRGFL